MPPKKLQGPPFDEWFLELEEIIEHEILSYLIDQNAADEGLEDWNNEDWNVMDWFELDCYKIGLAEVEIISETADENAAAIMNGETMIDEIDDATEEQVARFLQERDYLIQVLENNTLEELTPEAQLRLAVTYPLAKKQIESYINKTSNEEQIPTFVRSVKFNENYNIHELWHRNDIADVINYHTQLLNASSPKEALKISKPDFITSVKRNKYIDINAMHSQPEIKKLSNVELNVNIKWGVINTLAEPFRTKVIAYCNEVIEFYQNHLSKQPENDPNIKLDNKNLPIPPRQKRLLSTGAYNRYLPLLLGLYCKKNEASYKKERDKTETPKFNSFTQFINKDMMDNIHDLNERFENYKNTPNIKEVITKKDYINQNLSRTLRANIKETEKCIEMIKDEYFSCLVSM